MAKRRKGPNDSPNGPERVSDDSTADRDLAGKRFSVPREQLRGARITDLLKHADGGIERVVEALRWSDDADAIAFLEKYDSLSSVDRGHVSIDEVRVAAGVAPKRLLELAVSLSVEESLNIAKIIAASYFPEVIRKTAERALTDKGYKDRRMFLECVGFLPSPSGPSPYLADQSTNVRQAEKEPERLADTRSQASPARADT